MFKFLIVAVVFNVTASTARSQIGVATLAKINPVNAAIGTSSNIGQSTLPVCRPNNVSCSQAFTYVFTGNGNWTIETNWQDNAKPPAVLPAGAEIIIDPVPGGEAVLNTVQTISDGATIKVKAGRKLKVLNNLIIEH